MVFNDLQHKLLALLKSQLDDFIGSSQFGFFSSRLRPLSGCYIYGNVGSGKTTIMKHFFDRQTKLKKLFIHYQQLVKAIHQQSNDFSGKADYITLFAKKYFKDIRLLCIDELEIKDPADAAIIYYLVRELVKKKIFVVFSSNFHPEDFEKTVLNKDLIRPLINLFSEKYFIFGLSSSVDYRMQNMPSERILFSRSQENIAKLGSIVSKLTASYENKTVELENFGRKIVLKNTFGPILLTNFSELCEQKFSYSDYISICEKFAVIVISDVPVISASDQDLIIRFINFIDNVYFYKVLFFALFETSLEDTYRSGPMLFEYRRTVSRLIEIAGQNYVSIT